MSHFSQGNYYLRTYQVLAYLLFIRKILFIKKADSCCSLSGHLCLKLETKDTKLVFQNAECVQHGPKCCELCKQLHSKWCPISI